MRLTAILLILIAYGFIDDRRDVKLNARLDRIEARTCRAPIAIEEPVARCTTDTDCMQKFGGDGGPAPLPW